MFLETLDMLMNMNGLNKNTLSKESGIPYTTIVGFYTKGTDNVKLSTLRKLADFFTVTLDFLVSGEEIPNNPPPLTHQEQQLLCYFNSMNEEGQEKLIDIADDMVTSNKYIKSDSNSIHNKEKFA